MGAGGVLIAARSFRHAREQATTAFEDSLAREYRELTGALPPAAFYRHGTASLSDTEKQAIFRYFDLSNEQLRLIKEGRIRGPTAAIWEAGIVDLMQVKTFHDAWFELHEGLPTDFFSSLTRFLIERGLEPQQPSASQ